MEYEATCSEPEHRPAAGLSEQEAGIFLDAVLATAEPVKAHFLWRPQLRDPGDEMVLDTAVNGRADALVTSNVRDFGSVPERFGIEVLIPREANTIPYKGKDPKCRVAIRNPFVALGQRPNALCDCVDAIHLDLML